MSLNIVPGGPSATGGSSSQSLPHEVYPASHARHLDSRIRWLFYRPDRIAARYVKPGDHVLDFGCGPGFFTREFAKKAGDQGTVLAVDLQEEMLSLLRERLEPEGLMPRIVTHRCAPESLGLSPGWDGRIDAAFAIFVVHEVPDASGLFREITSLLVPGGLFFIAEPPFVVPGREFRKTLDLATAAGLQKVEDRRYFVNRAAAFRKPCHV